MGWLWSRPGLWVPLAVVLGLALRGYHYLRCPSVWHDEAALIVNVLALPFGQMFGPLIHAEAAPPLFLVTERAAGLALGDGAYALRLVPFLASCAALVLFAGVARRVLGPRSAALAVALFAVSDRVLWHSCEAKPYTLDVLAAVLAAWWFVRTDGRPLGKRCLPAAVVAPLFVWASFPACFVAGGLVVGLLPAGKKAGWGGRAALLGLVLSVGGSFIALALGPVAAQRCDAMDSCWTPHFPDWARPWSVPTWAVTQTFEVARYCLMPFGQVLAVFAGFGAAAVWRKPGGRDLVAVLLVPLGLAFAAALLGKYPYGGMRVEVFAAPAVCLLAAEGLRHVWPLASQRSRWLAGLCVLAFLPPFALTAARVVAPWPRAACDEAAAYVVAHRGPDDGIVMNHWEYEYYLRHHARWRRWFGGFEPADLRSGRVWVIHTTDHAAEVFPFPVPKGWAVADRVTFTRTAVFRLEPITGR